MSPQRRERGRPGSAERRRHGRRRLRTAFVMSPVPGVIKNMSPSGMQLETQEPLVIGRDYFLILGDTLHNARVSCRVRWCRVRSVQSAATGDSFCIYRLGVSFRGWD